MKLLSLLAASTLLMAAAPPAPETKADVRCFVALAFLGQSEDPNIKQAAAAGALYYLGRLDGRSPGLDLEAAVAAEVPGMSQAEVGSLLVTCGGTIEQRGSYLTTVGAALTERGKAKP